MPKLSFENGNWIYRCSKDERFPAKESWFRFESNGWKDPFWYSDSYSNAVRLHAACQRLGIDLEIDSSADEAARKMGRKPFSQELEIPSPPGLEYMPFQKEGIAHALMTRNTLIADEMGLGKTIQAIGVINFLKPKKTLLIVPASLKLNWKKELRLLWCLTM